MKTIESVVVRWGGDTDGYDVHARARLGDGSYISGQILYTHSESPLTRRLALRYLRRSLRIAGFPLVNIKAAFTAAADEEVL
jgi:hypothetical protein